MAAWQHFPFPNCPSLGRCGSAGPLPTLHERWAHSRNMSACGEWANQRFARLGSELGSPWHTCGSSSWARPPLLPAGGVPQGILVPVRRTAPRAAHLGTPAANRSAAPIDRSRWRTATWARRFLHSRNEVRSTPYIVRRAAELRPNKLGPMLLRIGRNKVLLCFRRQGAVGTIRRTLFPRQSDRLTDR